ncbi:MAG: L,D-transpeptidase [Fimbriimonadales bacterium]
MRSVLLFLLIVVSAVTSAQTIDVVTFASRPGVEYVPVREAAKRLGWPLEYDSAVELIKLRGATLDPLAPRLSDGTWLISVTDLGQLGADVEGAKISFGGRFFVMKAGPKRVEVDVRKQLLRAWQGGRLVYEWPVSSGREGKDTPNGDFKALEKEPMHISKLYGSPMPFSVHVAGNIYIHGSDRFSGAPGSHGCIRLPLMETRNIAEEFYDWIETGTPIKIRGAYEFGKR